MFERDIDHGLGTMKLNANYFFFPFFLIKKKSIIFFKKLSANYTFDLETFKVKATDIGHGGKISSRSIYLWS